jgi:hypothetical protein
MESMQITIASGSGAASFGIIGTGLAMTLPDQRWIGLCIIGLGILVFLFDVRVERGHIEADRQRVGGFIGIIKSPRTMPISLMIFGAALFIAGAIWLGIRNDNRITEKEIAIRTPSPLDQTILLDCQFSSLPAAVPPGGLYHMQLTGTDADYGFAINAQPVGSIINWGDPAPHYAYFCQLTNYGATPVLNVEADMQVEYLEAIKHSTGNRSGDVVLSKTLTTPRIYLGTGDKNTAGFYYQNRSPYWVRVSFPKEIRVQAVGTNQWQSVTLVPPPRFPGFSIAPFTPPEQPATDPQAEIPSSPKPPEPPAEK